MIALCLCVNERMRARPLLLVLLVRCAAAQLVTLGAWGACRCGAFPLAACSPLLSCMNVSVPLDYNNPSGQKITVHAMRVAASSGGSAVEPSAGELYWMNGGPAFTPLQPAASNCKSSWDRTRAQTRPASS